MWVWRITAAACFGELWRTCLRERHQKERGTESTRESEKESEKEERNNKKILVVKELVEMVRGRGRSLGEMV